MWARAPARTQSANSRTFIRMQTAAANTTTCRYEFPPARTNTAYCGKCKYRHVNDSPQYEPPLSQTPCCRRARSKASPSGIGGVSVFLHGKARMPLTNPLSCRRALFGCMWRGFYRLLRDAVAQSEGRRLLVCTRWHTGDRAAHCQQWCTRTTVHPHVGN